MSTSDIAEFHILARITNRKAFFLHLFMVLLNRNCIYKDDCDSSVSLNPALFLVFNTEHVDTKPYLFDILNWIRFSVLSKTLVTTAPMIVQDAKVVHIKYRGRRPLDEPVK